ncbi:uncharacterized protein LOC117504786 [Thalassophryne amazonica]|uniref:uncharacterized protein LOC117504786 n=1 Tax=Thalassophryne amazonica TaxID=390379 RepID=UPI00147266FB|nr:uncharacterized protein LOC117504786 [Thalassophryne amazonica]
MIHRIKLDDTRAHFFDISGCRFSGVFFRRGSKMRICSDTCKKIICTKAAVLQLLRSKPLNPCQGKQCQVDSLCTVICPSVISVHEHLMSVRDHCTYEMLVPLSRLDFSLLGNFQERCSKDVVFLERLILKLDKPNVLIHLEQGGRVLVGGAEVTLSSTPRLFHGVTLSKNESGVMAEASLSNGTLTVVFNGITAHIHLTEPGPLRGICNGSSRWLSDLSDVGCKMQHCERADRTIDCMKTTERPHHSLIIRHCIYVQQLQFPEEGALHCVQTPHRPCTLHHRLHQHDVQVPGGRRPQPLSVPGGVRQHLPTPWHLPAEGWRSNVNCSAPQIFCPDRICSAHEFCGETVEDGGTHCYCRAIFATKHRSPQSMTPFVCMGDSVSVTLPVCLLEAKGIGSSTLHLQDQTCRGQVDNTTHMVTFSFNSSNTCGTVVTANSSHIIYRNAIMNWNTTDIIIYVTRNLKDGQWRYTLTMKAYVDAAHTHAIDSVTRIYMNQRIWVVLKADGLDNNIVALVAESCWATKEPQPSASLRHDLIMNGCANHVDGTINVEANGLGNSAHFSFKVFMFSGKSRQVFLHCKLHLCIKKTATSCNPRCTRLVRVARSARTNDGNGSIITMAWTH